MGLDALDLHADRQRQLDPETDPPRLVAAGAVGVGSASLLLVRQWLGWTYVMQRLLSESVDYEESGWYDGQTWEKPLSWREKDLLVARHEVRPTWTAQSRHGHLCWADVGRCQPRQLFEVSHPSG